MHSNEQHTYTCALPRKHLEVLYKWILHGCLKSGDSDVQGMETIRHHQTWPTLNPPKYIIPMCNKDWSVCHPMIQNWPNKFYNMEQLIDLLKNYWVVDMNPSIFKWRFCQQEFIHGHGDCWEHGRTSTGCKWLILTPWNWLRGNIHPAEIKQFWDSYILYQWGKTVRLL